MVRVASRPPVISQDRYEWGAACLIAWSKSSPPPAARTSSRSEAVGVNLIPRALTSSLTWESGTPPLRREMISSLSKARGFRGAALGVYWATNWKCAVAFAGLVATISIWLAPGLRLIGSDQNSAALSFLGRSAAAVSLMVDGRQTCIVHRHAANRECGLVDLDRLVLACSARAP